MNTSTIPNDPYLWLEEVEGKEALAWVESQNKESANTFDNKPRFEEFKKSFSQILLDKDFLPHPTIYNNKIFNFWQDEKNSRGILRCTDIANFSLETIPWDILLDLDKLAEKEGENWVYQSMQPLKTSNRALINLSKGGKDANVVREYDLVKKEFVENGFNLPESKGWAIWLDDAHLLIARDFGSGTLTHSGYPRQIKVLARDQSLESAKIIFEVPVESVSAYALVDSTKGNKIVFHDWKTFFTNQVYISDQNKLFEPATTSVLPEAIDCNGIFSDNLILTLRKELAIKSKVIASGSVVALPLGTNDLNCLSVIFSPDPSECVQQTEILEDGIVLNILKDLQPTLKMISSNGPGIWKEKNIPLARNHTVLLVPGSPWEKSIIVRIESFLNPPEIFQLEKGEMRSLRRSKAFFFTDDLEMDQRFATSKDGTRIPYFIVHKKNMAKDGMNPTFLYGYGGFEIAMLPSYSSLRGKGILEKSGVFVVANIRGGNEYGPGWHQAALLKNRHKAYEDFIAIAEQLIKEKITSAEKLVIHGGSNGGLLMGVMYTQRPELFGGIICEVPLLDMLRYHKLLAGASWVGEYGDPEIPEMRDYISKYSPYQNVQKDKKYPEIFFTTSTKDDRVHPGHARKMAARLQEMALPYKYYENTDGGHAASKNIQETVKRYALIYSFFWEKVK